MRYIKDHKVNGLNENLTVAALDEPGDGGANHVYEISLEGNVQTHIAFQNGPIGVTGFNGISNESLLAVVIDRLRGFHSALFASRENALALTNLEQSLMWLQKRTRDRMARDRMARDRMARDRMARGVEGTHQK